MGLKLTYYTGCAVAVVFGVFNALSLSQRLLVGAGGVLGAGVCYCYLKSSRRAICLVYFNHHLLVSIKDEKFECIFPKAYGCRGKIFGKYIQSFNRCRESLSDGNVDTSKLHSHLYHMVQLRLCWSCINLEGIEDCVQACVEKWLIEIRTPSFNSKMRTSECNQDLTISGNDFQNISIVDAPIRGGSQKQDLPGAYPDNSQPRAESPSPSHPEEQQTILQPTASSPSPQAPVAVTETPTPTTPTTPTKGWCLKIYDVQKPETLYERISKDLQAQEVEAGFIYILRRDDDQEYYKVGFSKDPQARLEQHKAKCNAKWELKWTTDQPTKHAKRVEKLIHIDCGFMNIRYQENFCQTGRSSCTAQHKEIIKAPYEDVERCVKYWVTWIASGERYEEVPTVEAGALRPVWKLTDSHANLIIHDANNEFCLTSTGESWVQSPWQQKSDGRRKSTSALFTTKRPSMLQETRETQSARDPTRNTSSTLNVPGSLKSSSPASHTPSSSRRNNIMAQTPADRNLDDISQDNSPKKENVNGQITPQECILSSMAAEPSMGAGMSDPSPWSESVGSPAISIGRTRPCWNCSKQNSISQSYCVACLTPEPENDPQRQDCNDWEDDEELDI